MLHSPRRNPVIITDSKHIPISIDGHIAEELFIIYIYYHLFIRLAKYSERKTLLQFRLSSVVHSRPRYFK